MQQQIADVLVSIFLNISKISMNITYLKIRSGHLILILVISSYIYQFFTIISEIPYILVASGSLHQLFLCKSDEFLFSRAAGEKKHSDRDFLKELLLPLSSLDSYLRSGTARKFFDAAHSGSWVVADWCAQQVAHLEGPKGKALTEDQYVHLLLNASFSDELSPHQFSRRNKDSRSLMEHGVGYYLFKPLWTNKN